MSSSSSTTWVVNSSPLISLGLVGQFQLLPTLADEIYVVPAVLEEVLSCEDAASEALRAELSADTFKTVSNVDIVPCVRQWGLGPGETEVLSFAYQNRVKKFEVVVDDGAARRCALTYQIRKRGTLGVVLLAKQKGLIESAAEVVHSLQMVGLYLSPTLVADALALVDESPFDDHESRL